MKRVSPVRLQRLKSLLVDVFFTAMVITTAGVVIFVVLKKVADLLGR